jgi:hypothetical protein
MMIWRYRKDKIIPVNVTNAYGYVEVYLHSFLAWALDGDAFSDL